MKAWLLKAIFIGCLAAGLVLALDPDTHGGRHHFVPVAFRAWVNEHDDLENMIAFFLLTAVALRLPRARGNRGTGLPAVALQILDRPLARVAALMLLVCAIELAQLVIPDRVADFQDVCTGWSGIFAAWMLSVLMAVRGGRGDGRRDA
jgi:hypothetical protein